MSGDSATYRNEELVLRTPTDIDPKVWDENKYEGFLDALCGHRDYQKEAIRTVLRYLVGGRFGSLRELARWNHSINNALQSKYPSLGALERQLQLPDQMACSVDLATGTGKSYVLYGLAAIMLAEGIVDRVLVLSPSLTIEAGLTEKFRSLAADADLGDLLPDKASYRHPRIISASETIVPGAICVENYHAILAHVSSSIRDSLSGNGDRTLILNDEAHHVANVAGTDVRRWKEFVSDPVFGFKYVVGASGTCYVGNEYFSDVLYRYSLRQAIEERIVKRVEYISELPYTGAPEEKLQLIYQRHQDSVRRLSSRGIKPLTIVITRDIRSCKQVAAELVEFLTEQGEAPDKAAASVLAVTSAGEHQANVSLLKRVDDSSSPVEWIVSVAMLTEGWDVKNVFQIVPHEERAFNSKLLISQVLGRGLRRPNNWSGSDPVVTVFNHDSWSARIKHLVNEVLEIERRLTSRVDASSDFNFDVHTIDYTRSEDVSEYAKKGEYKLFESGYIELPTQIQHEDVAIGYVDAISERASPFRAVVEHRTWALEDVARQMFERLRAIDEETKDAEDPADRTSYAKRFPLTACEDLVRTSLKRANVTNGRVVDSNRQRFLQSLGTLRRKAAKRVVYATAPGNMATINTSSRPSDSASAAELRRGSKSIFYTDESLGLIDEEQRAFFSEVIDPDGDYSHGTVSVANRHDFKSPVNFCITDANPERRFLRELVSRNNSAKVDAWIKNTSTRFYAIEYAWKKGEHPKRGEFSPDFFIKQGDFIWVVEIKSDDEITDPSPENVKKHQFASQHFALINSRLASQSAPARYFFTMLTPKGYNAFFQTLRDGTSGIFLSELDVMLRSVEN